jgi:hypothetical protein
MIFSLMLLLNQFWGLIEAVQFCFQICFCFILRFLQATKKNQKNSFQKQRPSSWAKKQDIYNTVKEDDLQIPNSSEKQNEKKPVYGTTVTTKSWFSKPAVIWWNQVVARTDVLWPCYQPRS